MTAGLRDIAAVFRALLEPHGIPFVVDHGSKHPYVIITYGGQEHRLTITPNQSGKDGDCLNYTRQDVVRWMEKQGIVPRRGAPGEKRKRPHRRRVRSKVQTYEVGGSRISEDPWAALAALKGPNL